MVDFLCPYCDTALTRCALLALHLEKTVQFIHKELGHSGIWPQCELEPCRKTRAVLKTAGLDKEEKF